jgi:hypothetical protein
MNRRNLWLLIAAAVVAVIATFIYNANRNARWEAEHREVKVLPDLAVNEVTQIRITAPNAALTVARKDDLWRVAERNDYPADFSKVRDLLRTLWELKAVREVQIGPSQFERLQISPPGKGAGSGTQVEVAGQGGKILGTLIIGKALQAEPEVGVAAPSGRFVYNPANKEHAYVVADLFYGLEPLQVNQWLDKTFINAGEVDKVVREDAPSNPGWTIARPDPKGPWVFVPETNGEKVKEEPANLLSHFSPTFMDVRPPDTPAAETGLGQPVRAKLHTTDGFTYKLAIGKPGPDKTRYLTVQVDAQLPASRTPDPNEKPEDKKAKDDEFNKHLGELRERLEREKKFAGWVYEVPEFSVENLLKPRADLVNKPAPTPTPATPPAAPVPAVVPPTPPPVPAPPAPTPTPAATPPTAVPAEAVPTPSPSTTVPAPVPEIPPPTPAPSATPSAVPEVSPPESTPATGVQESTTPPAPTPTQPEATPAASAPGVESTPTPAPGVPEPTVPESGSPATTPGAPTPPPSAASPDTAEGTPTVTPAAP